MRRYLFLFIAGSFICSHAEASEQFVCKAAKHTVAISLLPSGKYQYRSWNKPKSITDDPDMVLVGGEEITEGTGVCRYTRWEFKKKNVEYIVSTPVTCTESVPPPNATGQLSVFINNEHKKSWWCLE